MIVVADTSPITYLAELGLTDLLHRLYGNVLLPKEVQAELLDPRAPDRTLHWAHNLPTWATVKQAASIVSEELDDLDLGERSAIELAIETQADLLLVDESKARRVAIHVFGIPVAGTLAVLRDAHLAGWIDGDVIFSRLCHETSFRHSAELDRIFLASIRP
jgi:predicted nucleic acid-binding protein